MPTQVQLLMFDIISFLIRRQLLIHLIQQFVLDKKHFWMQSLLLVQAIHGAMLIH